MNQNVGMKLSVALLHGSQTQMEDTRKAEELLAAFSFQMQFELKI